MKELNESSPFYSLTKLKLLWAGRRGVCGSRSGGGRSGSRRLSDSPAVPCVPLGLGRCLCGTHTTGPKPSRICCLSSPLVSSSKGWMCQHHHLLIWKNRMTKKILSVSLILMDFNAV